VSAVTTLLQNSKLFRGVPTEQLNELVSSSRVLTVPKGKFLYKAKTPFNYLVLLWSGLLQSVEFGPQGKCVAITPIYPNQLVGMLYLFGDRVRDENLIALKESQVILIESSKVVSLLIQSPESARALCERLMSIIQSLKQDRILLAHSETASRIIGVLKKYLEQGADGWYLNHLPKQQEIADLANTTRETVSRTLSRLVMAGVIEKKASKIRIAHPELLR
jgi:CRP-like cAMP-binding protein